MTIALWCILAASLLPTIFAGFAKSKMRLSHNPAPREFKKMLEGWRKRAHWAELNSYESLPPFAAAVLVAHIAKGDQNIVNILAIVYILARIAYGAYYMLDKATLRSTCWFIGVVCTVGLYIVSAFG